MAKCLVRGASGFSNRRFERRFCPLLPTGAKVGRAAARNLPLQAAAKSDPRPQARNGSCAAVGNKKWGAPVRETAPYSKKETDAGEVTPKS